MADHAYDVVAVRYGELPTTRSDVYLNHADYGEPDAPSTLAYYFWVVRGADRTVVLDTGFSAESGRRRGRTLRVDPVVAFRALEVPDVPETTVVLSHAHYDHVGNLDAFAHAGFVMSAAEYAYWIDESRHLPVTHRVTEPVELDRIRTLREQGRLRLVDGEEEIAPGVRVLPAPGHTPGQLMLLVQEPDGGILLTADAVHTDEELARRMPFRHMCDLPAAAATYDLVDGLVRAGAVRLVVAGHEPSLMGRFPADPRLPEHSLVLSDR